MLFTSCLASAHFYHWVHGSPPLRACPQQRRISSRRKHCPYSSPYFLLSKKTEGKATITAIITTEQFKTGYSLATPLSGETSSAVSWVLVPMKEYFALTSPLLEMRVLWGAHAMFVYLWRPKPHVEGVQDLQGAIHRQTSQALSFLWNGPHLWLREMLPRSESSLPGSERSLCCHVSYCGTL